MTKFLTTSGITFHLEELIKSAKERLILISPFLKVNERLRQLIEDKDRDKIDIRVIYGKNELQPEENNWLKSKAFVRSSFCKNLHAKCFMNESEALITSMNLYEFSQVNNEEMGILVSKADNPSLYASVYEEAMRLIRISEEIRVTVEKIARTDVGPEVKASHNARTKVVAPEKGVCIRCKADLKADPTHPYCKDCYGTWRQFENPEYEEKFCHLCGKPNKSTMRKPTCYDCYRAFKGIFTFSAT
ncbi:MAG: phospholipase D family protein [Nitrososphaera sp.]|nr:phospholipase D family protein [Nitrososphaera sp.]